MSEMTEAEALRILAEQVGEVDCSQPHTFQLKNPITNAGQTPITTLTMRPMTGRDFRRIRETPGPGLPFAMEVATVLCDQLPAVMNMVRGEDLGMVQKLALLFFADTQGTGKS